MTTTYFDRIYEKVRCAVEDNVPDLPENWLKCKSYESTLAKALLVHYLEREGFSRRMIVYYTGLQKSTVKQHINGYNERVKTDRLLRLLERELQKTLGR